MRNYLIALMILGWLPPTLWMPHIGVLLWTWISVMAPHRLAWGFITTAPVNLVVALFTFAGWLFSGERKMIPLTAVSVLIVLFLAWTTLTTTTAIDGTMSWAMWDRNYKTMLLGLTVMGLITTRTRIHALVWIVVLSLGFYGVKGGGFLIASGGGSIVEGVEYTDLGDNNNLALALIVVLPLMNYLRLVASARLMRLGLAAMMGLTTIAVLGTYSRGGLIGLGTLCVALVLRSPQRLRLMAIGIIVLVPALSFMPERWVARMDTITSARTDDSFMGRLEAWQVAMNIAAERPVVGGGFSATEVPWIFQHYAPGPTETDGRAAHSIYFQVLGDHGYVGLAIFLSLLAAVMWTVQSNRQRAARHPELAWLRELSSMVQVSMVSYMVCGAALSMAYFDVIYVLFGVTVATRQLLTRHERALRETRRRAAPAPAALGPAVAQAG